jgi:hypothetical protein
VDHLPLEVRDLHDIVVDHADRAHPGRREILERGRAEPASPHHQHLRRTEPLLPRPADLAQRDVARVAASRVVRRAGGASSFRFSGRTRARSFLQPLGIEPDGAGERAERQPFAKAPPSARRQRMGSGRHRREGEDAT